MANMTRPEACKQLQFGGVNGNTEGMIDDELLIDLVRSYRIIWFTGGRGYKDSQKKNQAWREIAMKMDNIDGKTGLFRVLILFLCVTQWRYFSYYIYSIIHHTLP